MNTQVSKTTPWYKTEGVNGKTFPTKKALEEHIRGIINNAPLNKPLSGDDTAFLFGVLQHHPEWGQKTAGGVSDIEVRMNIGDHFANRGLWLIDFFGGEIDISWRVAVDAKPRPRGLLIRDAARHAVADQIRRERDRARPVCGICGLPVPRDDAEVDHEAPFTFETILQGWISEYPDPKIDDAGLHAQFADEREAQDWRQYHFIFASLRVLHSKCHRSIKKTSGKSLQEKGGME